MSQENVDKTRDYIDAYNRRDFDAATRWFDPDVEWVLPEHQRSDSAIGVKGIIRFWEGLDETFDVLQLLPQEYVDAGDSVATACAISPRARAAASSSRTSCTTRSSPSGTA